MSTPTHQAFAQAAATDAIAPRRWLNQIAARLQMLPLPAILAPASRLAMAAVFWLSGRTKVDGALTVSDSAIALFADEYRLPVLPPELAAHLAAYAEHLLPILLVLGLCTRLSALALLGMTLVIQVFVYPMAWPTHLSWAVPLIFLAARGAGPLSLDRWLGIR